MRRQLQSGQAPYWLQPPALIAIVCGLLILKLWVAGTSGLAKDEGYYALWSLHPAAGYLDHPPLVAWFIAAGRLVLGNSELGVRVLAVLAGLLVTLAIYRTGRILLDPGTAALAAIWYNLNIAGGLGFITTPDTPSVLFWTLAVWALAEFMASGNALWWLAVGLSAGLGVEGKYTNLFLGLGILLFVLVSRERRRWLALWQLWAGALIALFVVVPNIVWNAGHGWSTIRFQGGRLGETETAGNLLELLAAQALFLGPPLALLTLVGAAMFFLAPRSVGRGALALPLLTSLPAWLYFLVRAINARVEANWVLPVWPMLTLVGVWAATRAWNAGWARTLAASGRVAQGVFGAASLALVYAQMVFQPFDVPAVDRSRELRGWADLRAEIEALATGAGAGSIVTVGDYGLTGQLATYGLFAGDTVPVDPLAEPVRYAFLPPLSEALARAPALYVAEFSGGSAPPVPDGVFAQASLVGVLERRHRADLIATYAAYRVTLLPAEPAR